MIRAFPFYVGDNLMTGRGRSNERMHRALAVVGILAAASLAGCVGSETAPAGAGPLATADEPAFGADTGALTGIVLTEELQPIAGALVALADSELQGTTAVDGRFTFSNLAPGPYRLLVQALGFQGVARNVDVAAGSAADVQVTLAKLAVVEPYIELLIYRGYSICDVNTIYISLTLALPGCEARRTVFNPIVNETWRFAIVEVEWQTNEAMNIVSDLDGTCLLDNSNPCFIWLVKRSPARFEAKPQDANYTRYDQFLYPAEEFRWQLATFSAGLLQQEIADSPLCLRQGEPTCAGVGGSLGTAFDQYVSIFHHEEPSDPAVYSARPDA